MKENRSTGFHTYQQTHIINPNQLQFKTGTILATKIYKMNTKSWELGVFVKNNSGMKSKYSRSKIVKATERWATEMLKLLAFVLTKHLKNKPKSRVMLRSQYGSDYESLVSNIIATGTMRQQLWHIFGFLGKILLSLLKCFHF